MAFRISPEAYAEDRPVEREEHHHEAITFGAGRWEGPEAGTE
jgi:hypothetical protein